MITTACTEKEKYIVVKDENGKLIAQKVSDLANASKIEKKVPTIAEFTSKDKAFSTLTSLIKLAGMENILKGERSMTILAPLNTSFQNLSPNYLEKLKRPENKDELKRILQYHIIPGRIAKEDMAIAIEEHRGSVSLRTLGGTKLTATLKGDRIFLIDERGTGGVLITTDVEASNGLIHSLDAVMIPKK